MQNKCIIIHKLRLDYSSLKTRLHFYTMCDIIYKNKGLSQANKIRLICTYVHMKGLYVKVW